MKVLKHSRTAALLVILLVMGLGACKSTPVVSSTYSPNEFTLLLATSNEGEVGPCG